MGNNVRWLVCISLIFMFIQGQEAYLQIRAYFQLLLDSFTETVPLISGRFEFLLLWNWEYECLNKFGEKDGLAIHVRRHIHQRIQISHFTVFNKRKDVQMCAPRKPVKIQCHKIHPRTKVCYIIIFD